MMKYLFLLPGIFFSLICKCQSDHTKLPSLAIHFVNNDFETAAKLRATSLSEVLMTKEYQKKQNSNFGFGVSFMKGATKKLDLSLGLSGSFPNYDVPNTGRGDRGTFLLEADANVNLKLLTDRYRVNPFLTAGIGAYEYRRAFGLFFPTGVGLQVKIISDVFLLFNFQYRIPITDKAAYHFHGSVGIAAPLVGRKKSHVITPQPILMADRDKDGIADSDDKCPDLPGIASLQGCPDRDADGIADGEDKCPDVPGLLRYNGCPIPDTDGDGIDDEADKCPAIKGVEKYNGCPIPDSDGDGVNDEIDKCPAEAGIAANMGCPEIAKAIIERINSAAKNIFFETGSTKLLPRSFRSLDEVALLLSSDERLIINIYGHTDSIGNPEKNQTLSDGRADAVKSYLTSKGIAEVRMTATGYGSERPVASNQTVAGRAKNRRVEIAVQNY